MREFVAVNDTFLTGLNIEFLKREALMFDRIALPFFNVFASGASSGFSQLISEVEWLIDSGIVFEPELKSDDERVQSSDKFKAQGQAELKLKEELDELFLNHLSRRVTVDKENSEGGLTPASRMLLQKQIEWSGVFARYFSLQLRLLDNMDARPVLPSLIPQANPDSANKSDIAQIALRALPVPDYSTSWEQILEYRTDPDSQSKFLALRHWMSEVARAELTPAEVEEKLEYLLDQYQRHLKLHRMKTNVGTLETVVTTGAEVLGDLVSFKWGKAAEAMFSLRRRKVALLEGELTAPGNEVAYILKARETFES